MHILQLHVIFYTLHGTVGSTHIELLYGVFGNVWDVSQGVYNVVH